METKIDVREIYIIINKNMIYQNSIEKALAVLCLLASSALAS